MLPTIAENIGPQPRQAHVIRVLTSSVRIHDLTVDREVVVRYLQTIPSAKQELALLHLMEVGVTTILARREGR